MPIIDHPSLLCCLQALERAIEYNNFLSQSETVEGEDFEEMNYFYEQTIRKLASIYTVEYKKNKHSFPISKVIKNKDLYFSD